MTHPVLELESEYNARVAELDPFDACAWLGYPRAARVAYPDESTLKEAMLEHGIRRALVSHTLSELHDPVMGNTATAKALAGLPGCAGVMTLLPAGTGEIADIGTYVDECLGASLRVARIFPRYHRYTLRVPTVPPMLKALEERGVPLFIQIGQTSWDEIGALALNHPRLAILVEGTGHHEYLNIRGCLPWLEKASNLFVPTHAQFLCGGLELLVDRLGAHRVLFSTNQPVDDPACGLSLLAFSHLPLETRRQIAHGNLERLLQGVGKGGINQ